MIHKSLRLVCLFGLILLATSVAKAQYIGVYASPGVVYAPGQPVVAYQPAYTPVVATIPASPVYVHSPVVASPVYAPALAVPATTVVMGVRPAAVRETVRYQPHGYTYSVHANEIAVPNSAYRLRVNEHRHGVTIRERVR
ncbi:MAG: hypothetical protein FJ267_15980 [Planctomycetes bacterium]|nr:hypothetical protein [Planctomycetota bacterium]